MYLVLKVACERKDVLLQGPEIEEGEIAFPVQAVQMERQQRERYEEADSRRALQRNRQIVNLRAAGNKACPQEHDERL